MKRSYFLKMNAIIAMSLLFGLNMQAYSAKKKDALNSFYFIQVSDTHWGFNNTNINPDSAFILKKTIAEINRLEIQPDFIAITGDLTHTTDDPQIRRKRLTEFKAIIEEFKVKDIKLLPGEHDAGLDNGEAYREIIGKSYYSFEHKGVHFIALDNVSEPGSTIGDTELKWLASVLKKFKKNSPIVILTHRPLYDVYPQWDWATQDGDKARKLLKPYKNVIVLYGHIHQLLHQPEGNLNNYAANSTIYSLPAPGSVPKKAPIQWNPDKPYEGLGFRLIEVKVQKPEFIITEYPLKQIENETVIKIEAKKFKYDPNEIHIKVNTPVILELSTADVRHGIIIPDIGIRTNIEPGKLTQLRIEISKAGTNSFHCDIFCGEGHEDMTGMIIVEE